MFQPVSSLVSVPVRRVYDGARRHAAHASVTRAVWSVAVPHPRRRPGPLPPGVVPPALDDVGVAFDDRLDVDVLAAEQAEHRLECSGEVRRPPAGAAPAPARQRRAALVRGYEPKSFYLFSKHALSKGTIEKAEGMPEWHLVTIGGLYR